jgi:hypothetical protein
VIGKSRTVPSAKAGHRRRQIGQWKTSFPFHALATKWNPVDNYTWLQ